MGIKRGKKKKLGAIRGAGATGTGGEQSPRRPKFVEKTPPCQAACPQGTDIRGILTTIANGEKLGRERDETFMEVFEMLTENNPLPSVCGRVCPHPCEVDCNRNSVDEPASINNVERFVGDWGLERNIPLKKLTDEKHEQTVGVIGAGPAGLSAAYHLAKRGYGVTIYEAFPKAGGMLRYGIPPYRLPPEIIDGEVQRILDLGVEMKTDVSVGKDIPFEELRKQHDAIFVGIGAHKGKLLRCPGEDADNVWTGTSFLNRANRGEEIDVGKKVLVIGGGDTAIDAARVARRMGADVTIVYRRTRNEMPAIDEEVKGAEEENVEMHFLAAPIEIHKEGNTAVSMRCQQMELGEPDDSGRRRPVPIEGEEFTLECDTIIAAISQEPDFDGLEEVKAGPRDWVKADDGGAVKDMDDVYAGGDTLDLGLVTIAIAQGRLAAETIHQRFQGIEPEEKDKPADVVKTEQMALGYYEKLLRQECSEMSVEERLKGNDEIVSTFTEEQVLAEAARCLSCGSCFDCGTCWSYCQEGVFTKPLEPGQPYRMKLELCKGCDKCAENCPCGYIEMYDPTAPAAS